jgi:hypothetical protein
LIYLITEVITEVFGENAWKTGLMDLPVKVKARQVAAGCVHAFSSNRIAGYPGFSS